MAPRQHGRTGTHRGPLLGVGAFLTVTLVPPSGITQEKIEEARAATEHEMVQEIRRLVAAGADLDAPRGQGATLVGHGDTGARRVMPNCP